MALTRRLGSVLDQLGEDTVAGNRERFGLDFDRLIDTTSDTVSRRQSRVSLQERSRRISMVGLYKSNAVDPQLESARSQPLSLKCDILVSKCAFKS